jgi:hypothetical protein
LKLKINLYRFDMYFHSEFYVDQSELVFEVF